MNDWSDIDRLPVNARQEETYHKSSELSDKKSMLSSPFSSWVSMDPSDSTLALLSLQIPMPSHSHLSDLPLSSARGRSVILSNFCVALSSSHGGVVSFQEEYSE
jgi:hypothetical protein